MSFEHWIVFARTLDESLSPLLEGPHIFIELCLTAASHSGVCFCRGYPFLNQKASDRSGGSGSVDVDSLHDHPSTPHHPNTPTKGRANIKFRRAQVLFEQASQVFVQYDEGSCPQDAHAADVPGAQVAVELVLTCPMNGRQQTWVARKPSHVRDSGGSIFESFCHWDFQPNRRPSYSRGQALGSYAGLVQHVTRCLHLTWDQMP